MKFIKRVYVAGVGYTSYLTKSPVIASSEAETKTEFKSNISTKSNEAKPSSISGTKTSSKIETKNEVYLDHFKGSAKNTADQNSIYTLNFKIGFSDLKQIDLTPYLTEDIEILVVGKEIITTPGYQELATEVESFITASEIKSIVIIRGNNKLMVNSLAALIRNLRPYSVYKGIGLRLEGDPLILKTFVKSKHK